jgi:hypothetical protein
MIVNLFVLILSYCNPRLALLDLLRLSRQDSCPLRYGNENLLPSGYHYHRHSLSCRVRRRRDVPWSAEIIVTAGVALQTPILSSGVTVDG